MVTNRDRNIGISNPVISDFSQFEIPVSTMTQYRDFEIVIEDVIFSNNNNRLTETVDDLAHKGNGLATRIHVRTHYSSTLSVCRPATNWDLACNHIVTSHHGQRCGHSPIVPSYATAHMRVCYNVGHHFQ